MTGFNRRTWRDFLQREYGDFSEEVRLDRDFASFADDMRLLLKWRQSKHYDDWLVSFKRFAGGWGQETGAPRDLDNADPAVSGFLSWFDLMNQGFVLMDDGDRADFLDWLSLGADLPSTDIDFNEAPGPPDFPEIEQPPDVEFAS